ncbi:hydratase [Shinella sp. CPCC 101442]|uniref:2-keto-4-pentenoate hydratase n=1 Tax=Shinella sp. CPCC 101442 TaxID=2932265 RepID=UPI0021522524|nr:fumarylacetoacetate hydrolase family protein [Shinella sp. CPCC 101442]MCR6502926.1 hydratase [Shinella sp. CPCC 101442]
MSLEFRGDTAAVLAESRRLNVLCDLPLDRIASQAEAYDILAAAEDAYSFERGGYAVVGSGEAVRKTLGLATPIFSEIPASGLLRGQRRFKLPAGVIGAQCELVFSMLRPFPDAGEAVTLESAADAVFGCMPAIGILGRRTRSAGIGTEAAIADFALHAATICGGVVTTLGPASLATIEVGVSLDGRQVLTGRSDCVMGHPLNAVAWLARQLSARGHKFGIGDVVATGSCTTILQVLPGQTMVADFGPLGSVECSFH